MISVVIPTYKCKNHILKVLSLIGPEVDKIYVVDDACPDKTGQFVLNSQSDPRVVVLFNEQNQGVGGAVINGYLRAKADGCKIAVKIDGDGQMDPRLIKRFIAPLVAGEADYSKGNRFNQIDYLIKMPPMRIFGNAVLSFFTKFSSGYWNIFDPTNGYTAIHTAILDQINLSKISKRYFFESDLLFRLNICRAVVIDIPMPAIYGDEISGLNELSIVPTFLKGHFVNFSKRIFYNYFLRDFSLASIELVFGLLFLLFGISYGLYSWINSYENHLTTPSGVVMLAALPIILGIQFLMGFAGHDISTLPTTPLHKKITL